MKQLILAVVTALAFSTMPLANVMAAAPCGDCCSTGKCGCAQCTCCDCLKCASCKK